LAERRSQKNETPARLAPAGVFWNLVRLLLRLDLLSSDPRRCAGYCYAHYRYADHEDERNRGNRVKVVKAAHGRKVKESM
jgi:hypothetical protein